MVILVILLYAANHFFIFGWIESGLRWGANTLAGWGYESAAYQVLTVGGIPKPILPWLIFALEVVILFVLFPRVMWFFDRADKGG